MGMGKVVGSNMLNVLMIMGWRGVVVGIEVGEGSMSKEIGVVIVCGVVVRWFGKEWIVEGGRGEMMRGIEGVVVLGLLVIFMGYSFGMGGKGKEDGGEEEKVKKVGGWK